MSQQVLGTSEVVVIHHPEGIRHGCAKCGQIHLSGQYMVGVVIVEGGTSYNYLVGFDPKQRCCGEEKKFFPVLEAGVQWWFSHEQDEPALLHTIIPQPHALQTQGKISFPPRNTAAWDQNPPGICRYCRPQR